MTATFKEAVDDIFGTLLAAWTANGLTHAIYWPDKAGKVPSGSVTWVRPTLRHLGGGQASLGNAEGVTRWERGGVLIVQVFTPIASGLSEGYNLAKIVADAYEGKRTEHGVWFRNVRINEVGPDGDWQQLNVVVDFTYDEVK